MNRQLSAMSSRLYLLGLATLLSAVGYALAQYWDSPSPDVCQTITDIEGTVPKGCGPVNWGPFWILMAVTLALLTLGYLIRPSERQTEKRTSRGFPPH